MPSIAYLPTIVPLTTSAGLMAGARLFTYITGTSTPKNTYTDFALGVAHPNPVVANSNGVFPVIYLANDARYRFDLKFSVIAGGASVSGYPLDDIGGPLVTQAEIGAILYPQTTAEQSAGVTPVNYAYPYGNVKRYGAIGNGTTNDTAALANAVLASRNLLFPAGTYPTTLELLYDSTAPVRLVFEAGAYLKTTGATNRAIHITGQPAGTTSVKLVIENPSILVANSGTADSAIFLDGTALVWIKNPVIVGTTCTAGILGKGCQQGEIHGGYIAQMPYGIHLYRDASANVGSNGVEIHGVSLNTTNTEILVEDSDSALIHDNHMIGAPIGIDIVSTTNSTFARVVNNHIEGPSGGPFTAGVQVRGALAAGTKVNGNIIQGTGKNLWIKNGTGIEVDGNTFSAGDVAIDSGVTNVTISNNYATAPSATTYTQSGTSVTQFGNSSAGSAFDWGDLLSPAQITANQNDYNPTGLSKASHIRLSTDASRTLTGLAGGWSNRTLRLYNVGANDLVLSNADAASTAANRFELGANKTLTPSQGITVWYDLTGARWRSAGRLA